jgi:hypothetical protein
VSDAPRAWVLNLDAEHELETRGSFTPGRHLNALVARERRQLLGTLVAPGDIVLTDGDQRADGLIGLAWSPTPRALARLEAAGAHPMASPSVDVLREVNARPFAAAVRAPLAEDSFAKHVAATLDEALERIAAPAPAGWLVRRSFGAAGRGRRRIASGKPTDDERAWLVASLRLGPLTLEPWVAVTREYTRSGWVAPSGDVVIAPPCFQKTTKEGAWTRTDPAGRGEVDRADDARLEEATAAAGTALARAGYFGAFGIDAFRHRPLRTGARAVLNPMSEVNARFTMDWTTGMAGREPHRASFGPRRGALRRSS